MAQEASIKDISEFLPILVPNSNSEDTGVVQKGDIIGKTSEETRSGKNGFLLLCTVHTTLIDPTYIIGKNITFPAS